MIVRVEKYPRMNISLFPYVGAYVNSVFFVLFYTKVNGNHMHSKKTR